MYTCLPAGTDHHQALWSLLGCSGSGERKKWVVHSSPPMLCDTCGRRETREAQLYVLYTCEARVGVLVGELGNLGPGSGHYGLLRPPGQDSAQPCGPPPPSPSLLLHTLRVSPVPCLTETAPAHFLSGWAECKQALNA